jgi:hypothetical protein
LNHFRDFLVSLESLDWSPAGYIDAGALELLTKIGQEPNLLGDVVRSWDTPGLENRQLRCHETSTHYKWFIHYSTSVRYRIWLHQYKPMTQRTLGHAEVPHNHRYSLASVILNGGFVHRVFERTDDGLRELADERQSFMKGDAYMVPWQRVHRLDELADGTLTLVVESPIVRHFSEAFYGPSSSPSVFYDFVALHSRLVADMASV